MNFASVKDAAEFAIRGARVHFEHEDNALKRIILLTDSGATFIIRANDSSPSLKVLKARTEETDAQATPAPADE